MKNGMADPVFLDVDGVLVDSLPQHLAICRDKAREFGLDLQIPDVPGFRRLVAQGVKVSPMFDFFLAVGFPAADARHAVEDYEREFMQSYRPPAFPGIDAMLGELAASGHKLGLVTANTEANVVPALGDAFRHFDASCIFYFDSFPKPRSKAWCLKEGARRLGASPGDCVFVGDQPADRSAAREAGFIFLGVNYGWGFPEGSSTNWMASSVADIGRMIRSGAVRSRVWA